MSIHQPVDLLCNMQYALCNSGMQHALMQEQLLTAYCLLLTANFTQHMNTQEDRQSHMQTVTIDLAASGLTAIVVTATGLAPSVRRHIYWA